jgi:gas vesicle protein
MRKKLRTTGLALLAASAVLVAGCGGDSEEDRAREQVDSIVSQAQEQQSQIMSQAAEQQSDILSQVGELTEDLGALTADVPELPDTTEIAPEATAADDAPAETAASGDLIAGEDVKAALEGAAGVTLAEGPGAGAGGVVSYYSNEATMMEDGQVVMAWVLSDPQAAEAFQAAMPQLPASAGGSVAVSNRNVIVGYGSLGGPDNAAAVKAAIDGL